MICSKVLIVWTIIVTQDDSIKRNVSNKDIEMLMLIKSISIGGIYATINSW